MATFRERPEIRWPQDTRYNVSDAAFFVDDDGFKYDVYKYISPDDGNATVGIIEKRSPADAHVTTWEVTPRAGWKIASLGSFWTEGGMAMRLYIYDLAISGSRPNSRETVVVPVGFNGDGLLAEAGGATTFLPDEESGGGGVTREEVEQVMRAELPRYFDPKVTAIVDNMPLKMMSTLGDLYDPAAREHEKPAYRALVVRAQDKAFKRNDDDFYLIINKLITGQDPNHPVANEPFKALIKQLLNEVLDERGTEPTEGGTPNG